MARRKKYRGEPDYRFYPYNQIKDESRAIYRRANLETTGLILLFLLGCAFAAQNFYLFTLWILGGPIILLIFGNNFFRNAKDKVEELAQDVLDADKAEVERQKAQRYRPEPTTQPTQSVFSAWRVAKQTARTPQPVSSRVAPPTPSFDLSDLPDFYDLNPTEFEHEVASLFRRMAHVGGKPIHADVVGKSGDGGIDIRLRDHTGMLVGIVQVKRYDPSKTLDPGALRELDSVRKNLGVRKAYLVTTARFSARTIDDARDLKIDLIDGVKFNELWRKTFNPHSSPAPTTYVSSQPKPSPAPTISAPYQTVERRTYEPEIVHKGGMPITKPTPTYPELRWDNLTPSEKYAEMQRRKHQQEGIENTPRSQFDE